MQEVLCCPKCECSYLEEVKINRYSKQRTPIHQPFYSDQVEFYLLRCIKCQAIVPHEAEEATGTKAQYVYANMQKELFEEETSTRIAKTKRVEDNPYYPFTSSAFRNA